MTRTRYTVYDNLTDYPIIVCGTPDECAALMGITTNAFRQVLYKQRHAPSAAHRWFIVVERNCDW